MDVETNSEREKMVAELEERYSDAIAVNSSALYSEEQSALGIAVVYLECDCVELQGFDQDGELVGNSKTLRDKDSCTVDHSQGLDGITGVVVHRSILWKDSPEEFDRKYGNEKRIEIASKLFPPL